MTVHEINLAIGVCERRLAEIEAQRREWWRVLVLRHELDRAARRE